MSKSFILKWSVCFLTFSVAVIEIIDYLNLLKLILECLLILFSFFFIDIGSYTFNIDLSIRIRLSAAVVR